jgi:putative ABC transport system ATP-binding protein
MNKTASDYSARAASATTSAARSVADAAVHARGLVKRFQNGRITALADVDLEVDRGEFVAVCGPSGCGKSTLLHLIAGIERPDAGRIAVMGRILSDLTEAQGDRFRSSVIGMVFQLHNLLPHLTALENVQAAMLSNGVLRRERPLRAAEILERVGLTERAHALPPTMSGGERQRVAIARALANRPRLLLADEPTGALDSRTGAQIFDLLAELRRDLDMTLLVVTHDGQVAARAHRIVHILDGRTLESQGGAPEGHAAPW